MTDLQKEVNLSFKRIGADLYEVDGQNMTFKELTLWMKEKALEK